MIDPALLVAPRAPFGVLVEPRGAPLLDWARRDWRPALRQARVLDSDAAELRDSLRRRLGLGAAPLLLTGHQVEFFHAGVFAKTLAAGALAQACQGQAGFVLVDSDVPKDHVFVPQAEGEGCVRRAIPIPGLDPRFPIETTPMPPQVLWREFFGQLQGALQRESMLTVFAEAWLDEAEAGSNPLPYGRGSDWAPLALARGQSAVARALGAPAPWHVAVSTLCDTPEFRAFVAQLAHRAADFAQAYNRAQAAYRRRRRVRNPARPAPRLHLEAERIELPFWVYRSDGRRQRLFVAPHPGGPMLMADREVIGPAGSAPRLAACESAWECEQAGWRIRPRALALSAFMRMFLADLFIHGIGGAKYDEMTDEFLAGFFGAPPPPFACVTATLPLRTAPFGVSDEGLRAAQRALRDLRYNPQRQGVAAPPGLAEQRERLLREQERLRASAGAQAARQERRRVYQELQTVRKVWAASGESVAAQLRERIAELERRRGADRIALDREYFFAFHTRESLLNLAQRLGTTLGA